MNLAEKLIYLRKKQGLTQLELAEKLDVSRQAVSRWEVGAAVPSTDKLKSLGELYGVTIDYLLNDTENIHDRNDEHREDKSRKNNKLVIFTLAFIVLAAVLTITLFVHAKHQTRGMPMEGMSTKTEEEYTTGIFGFMN